VLQAVDALADARGPSEHASLAVAVEDEKLLVGDVELAARAVEKVGQLCADRTACREIARRSERSDQLGDCAGEIVALGGRAGPPPPRLEHPAAFSAPHVRSSA
jgi:hypothetical protein